MRSDSQADRLSQMMQRYSKEICYEFALPYILLRIDKIKKLMTDDILLLNDTTLDFIVIKDEKICAKLLCHKIKDKYTLNVIETNIELTPYVKNKKYERLKLSFGTMHINRLKVGDKFDISQINLDSITLIVGKREIAVGSLVLVKGKLALKINKMKRETLDVK